LILVTGAAGFIGSNLCQYLTEVQRQQVVGLDNFSIGSAWANIEKLNPYYFTLEVGDLASMTTDHLQYILRKYDVKVVVHLAASSHVDRSISSDQGFYFSNVLGTANLMRACLSRGDLLKVFVNQITDEVYGSIEAPLEAYEDDVLNPTSPYASSKAGQYYVGLSYWKTFGLPVVSTFPSNTFGPRQYPEKFIPRSVLRVLRNDPILLMNSVLNTRDWLHVDDHCRALSLLIQKGKAGVGYNFGANAHITNQDLANFVLDWNGSGEIKLIPDRAGHDTRYAVNSERIASLGWAAQKNVHVKMLETFEWYKANAKQYEKVLL
jgi:dTDP-glucose 4,6-dehydratase